MCSLYARVGGREVVGLAVDGLFDRVRGDRELARYFIGRDVERHARHVRAFVAAALGGPELYRGGDLAAVHAGLAITDAHFERTLAHLLAALAGLGVDRALIGEVAATLEPLRARVVHAPALRAAA